MGGRVSGQQRREAFPDPDRLWVVTPLGALVGPEQVGGFSNVHKAKRVICSVCFLVFTKNEFYLRKAKHRANGAAASHPKPSRKCRPADFDPIPQLAAPVGGGWGEGLEGATR